MESPATPSHAATEAQKKLAALAGVRAGLGFLANTVLLGGLVVLPGIGDYIHQRRSQEPPPNPPKGKADSYILDMKKGADGGYGPSGAQHRNNDDFGASQRYGAKQFLRENKKGVLLGLGAVLASSVAVGATVYYKTRLQLEAANEMIAQARKSGPGTQARF